MNWIFCHELAHYLLDHPASDKLTPEMEREADELAAELMLPEADFQQAMAGHDLPRLKELYPHASWEAIARRWAQFRPALLTIYDNKRLTSRCGPEGLNFPARTTPPEMDVVRDCYREKKHIVRQVEILVIRGYFIEEIPGRKRVILLTEATN